MHADTFCRVTGDVVHHVAGDAGAEEVHEARIVRCNGDEGMRVSAGKSRHNEQEGRMY